MAKEENEMGHNVLLIEDDKIDQAAFKRMVEVEGLAYDCTIVGSVGEARSVSGGLEWFDVIISDYSLGDGTVLDVLASVEDVSVVVVTGRGNEEAVERALEAGACDYLVKDLEGEYLKILPEKVERIVEQK